VFAVEWNELIGVDIETEVDSDESRIRMITSARNSTVELLFAVAITWTRAPGILPDRHAFNSPRTCHGLVSSYIYIYIYIYIYVVRERMSQFFCTVAVGMSLNEFRLGTRGVNNIYIYIYSMTPKPAVAMVTTIPLCSALLRSAPLLV